MMQYAGGDAAAFDRLYARYKDLTFRYCLRQLPRQTAEDTHQEIWMNVIRSRNSFSPSGRFRAWLFTTAHNTLINRAKSELRQSSAGQLPDIPDTQTLEENAQQEARRKALLRGITSLPWQQRDTLLLQKEAGFSIDEISEITGASKEGVRSRLRYAMNKLRSQLGGDQDD